MDRPRKYEYFKRVQHTYFFLSRKYSIFISTNRRCSKLCNRQHRDSVIDTKNETFWFAVTRRVCEFNTLQCTYKPL